MSILANKDRLFESVLRVFWYAVYGLALFLIFAGEIWLAERGFGRSHGKKTNGFDFCSQSEPIKAMKAVKSFIVAIGRAGRSGLFPALSAKTNAPESRHPKTTCKLPIQIIESG